MRKKKDEFKNYPGIGKIYHHYKGGKYEVLTLAKHSETNQDLVIYKSLHFGSIHARPLKSWNGQVVDPKSGNKRARFWIA